MEETPFAILFAEGRIFPQSDTYRIWGNTPNQGLSDSVTSLNVEGYHFILQFNPRNLFLSRRVVDGCRYKNDLIKLLELRKQRALKPKQLGIPGQETLGSLKISHTFEHPINEDEVESVDEICEKVETLIASPMHEGLVHIFYHTFADKRPVLDLSSTSMMFPRLTDMYLRNTTFNPRTCNNLLKFVKEDDGRSSIERIFYSIDKPCADRDVGKLKLRLNEHRWDFSAIEQVAFKCELENI